MSSLAALRAGQAAAERLMTEHCTITRPTRSTNPQGLDTFEQVQVWEGKCKIQTYEPYETQTISAGTPTTEQRYQVHIPVAARDIPRVGDVITIVGRSRPLQVAGLLHKTHQTAVRLACVDYPSTGG